MYSFIETRLFSRLVLEYLSDQEYAKLQQVLIDDPAAGDLIPGAGGIRKLRWKASGRGKRGGMRVIYYWATEQERILMLLIYAKNESEDLTRDQIKMLRYIVEREYP